MRVRDALVLGERLPTRPGLPDPRREAVWLLAHAWGVPEVRVRLEPEAELPEPVAERYRSWLVRRIAGEPAHHLSGTCPFWGRAFRVSPVVLIPRPETELLVQTALELPVPAGTWVADIGTGSGCIAVTLAAERPQWRLVACDRSLSALAVAASNVAEHRVGVQLVRADLTAPLGGGFGLVVANLPYLPVYRLGTLPLEVTFDPVEALDGGDDGLDLVVRLLADLPRLLLPGGHLLLEIGEDQADSVSARAAELGLTTRLRLRDLGGCERVIALRKEEAAMPQTP